MQRAFMAFAVVCAFALTMTNADARPRHYRVSYESGHVIGGRPAGCPRRYCACALSLRIFGRIIADLNLAANWTRKFPRAGPAPDMVAARRGHAFQLISQVQGKVWRVYDANSGRGLTRIHERSIAGYTIVNPHGSRLAAR